MYLTFVFHCLQLIEKVFPPLRGRVPWFFCYVMIYFFFFYLNPPSQETKSIKIALNIQKTYSGITTILKPKLLMFKEVILLLQGSQQNYHIRTKQCGKTVLKANNNTMEGIRLTNLNMSQPPQQSVRNSLTLGHKNTNQSNQPSWKQTFWASYR